MQVVAIGMNLTSEHLAHIEPLQTSANRLNLFQSIDFKSRRGQRIAHLLRRQVEIDILLQPFIRNVHS